jgi:hypothetical protein
MNQDILNMQSLINSGQVWRMEGSMGRSAMAALESGACMLGTKGCKDYWGNYVPSRSEVAEGTKGSPQLVIEQNGQEWHDALVAVGDIPKMPENW